MVGRKEKKRLLRSNAQRERKILQRAQLFARRNSLKPTILPNPPQETHIQLEREVQEHLILSTRLQQVEQKANPSTNLISDTLATQADASKEAPVNNLRAIVFGEWEMQTWYASMYPPEVTCLPLIYICEFCLTYMRYNIAYRRHRLRCKRKFPPGNEIYRRGTLSFFEVDGEKQKVRLLFPSGPIKLMFSSMKSSLSS
ncbi:unnamed protein product [Dibothriocephalus latus]|uniref:Histone acetyltransferase n=1 Tax=Dibothriocephalus latus TaxID=60516 RepID=A0A3P7LSV4_DIBLA|nr:unnamed protein product [Dibothriocephalus latus]